jgi:hypothetical protein
MARANSSSDAIPALNLEGLPVVKIAGNMEMAISIG